MKLTEPHLSLSLKLMEEAGLDPDLILQTLEDEDENDIATLQLTRMIVLTEAKNSKTKQMNNLFGFKAGHFGIDKESFPFNRMLFHPR